MPETNPILQSLYARKSVRVFEEKAIPAGMKQAILEAATQAPSAGCQQLYTILDITDPALKAALADSCDHQPFIAKAPLVLVFCADCRKWYDAYKEAGCTPRTPGVGDLMLAVTDTAIAAQNAVVAAESAMEHIVHENGYRTMDGAELRDAFGYKASTSGFDAWCTAFHNRKYDSGFAREMSRSVAEYLEQYK